MKSIKCVYGEGMEALYLDDEKITEKHSITSRDWFRLGQRYPNFDFSEIRWFELLEEELEDFDFNFPKIFTDIPLLLCEEKVVLF